MILSNAYRTQLQNPPMISLYSSPDLAHYPTFTTRSLKFEVDNMQYSSVEQYMCYNKAKLFDTQEVADSIYAMDDPKDQKFRAKKLANFNATSWDDQSEDILMKALRSKFSQHEELKKFLLATGTTTIGEASAHDTKYGIGIALRNPNAMNTDRWRGGKSIGCITNESAR